MADDFYTRRLFAIESGGNPYALTGSNRGLGQFSPDLERRYGITDQNRADPGAQAAAVAQERAEHAAALRQVLGRDPTPGELYLAHQQGLAGATALLSNPDMPAWQVIRPYYKSDGIARSAIWGNVPADQPGTAGFNRSLYPGGADSITAGEFARQWINKFEGGNAPAAAMVPPAGQMPPSGAQMAPGGVQAPSAMGGAPVAGMLTDAGLGAPSGPDLGMLVNQVAQRLAQPSMPAPPPIDYPVPAGMRARLAAAALGRNF